MWERVRQIVKKEFRQALREPRMRALLVVPPIMQMVLFGFAVNLDVDRAGIAWMDLDRTPQSRELLDGFSGSGYFVIVAAPAGEEEVQSLLDRGKVQGVVRVMPGFGRDVSRGRPASVQVLVDGANSNSASIVGSYASKVVNAYSRRVMAEQQNRKLVGRTAAAGAPVNLAVAGVGVRSRVWFNPELHSRNYFVPGVLVNVIALVTLMLTALSIVREKEVGTVEQLMVTPIRPMELMLGKTLPFAVVGLVDLFLVTSVALLVFGVPFEGSAVLLVVCGLLYLLSTLGAGLFISTISRTQQQAMLSSFFFFMPAFMLSGFAFPIRNMPEAIQYLTLLNPLRYFMEIVRGLFLKGSGMDMLWPQMMALAAFGAAILGLSAMRFHKRVD